LHPLDGLLHGLRHIEQFFAQTQQAPADAEQVEQVIYQMGNVRHLPLFHGVSPSVPSGAPKPDGTGSFSACGNVPSQRESP